jgi:hypothetical protein
MLVPINEAVRNIIATRRTNLVKDSLGQCQQRSDPELRFLHLNLMGEVKGESFWLSPPGSFSYEKRVRTKSFRGSNFDNRDDMVDLWLMAAALLGGYVSRLSCWEWCMVTEAGLGEY